MPSITKSPPGALILAIDTSSSLGSVALARGAEILTTRAFEADRGHSRKLLPAIASAFAESQLDPAEVDVIAAVTGPGSFTGLRVSLACVRGLAGEKPCFGSLATDVAAWAGRGRATRILAITDLFHGEVFASVHDAEGTLISERESGDSALVLEALKHQIASRIDAIGGSSSDHGGMRPSLAHEILAVGSAASKHREVIERACPRVVFLDLPEGLAPHLATLASVRVSAETTCRAGELLPHYLRDALTRGLLRSPR